MTGLKICSHLWRWNDNDGNVTIRVNARGCQPGAKKKVMGGIVRNDTEREALRIPVANQFVAKSCTIPHATRPKRVGKSNSIPVLIEDQSTHAVAWQGSQAQRYGEGHRRESMG